MSLVRRTSVSAVAVAGLVLALVVTLVASGGAGEAAPGGTTASTHQRWVPAQSKAARLKTRQIAARQAASGGKARMVTFSDRILGAQPVLSYRGVADPTVARYPGGWVSVSTAATRPSWRSTAHCAPEPWWHRSTPGNPRPAPHVSCAAAD